MPAPRRNTNSVAPAPAKKRIRRNEETLIAALQQKIATLQERKARKALKGDPTLKLADKLVRMLKKAETQFMEADRVDLANSAKAAAISMKQTAF